MNTTHTNDLPMAVCPHCEETIQIDDYSGVKPGDSFECPRCTKEMHVTSVDVSIYVDLSAEAV